MRGAVDIVEVERRVDGSKERAVKPASSLKDELGDLAGGVCDAVRGLDVVKQPSSTTLADELPAQDTILGEVHVCFEDTRTRSMLSNSEYHV